MIAAGVNPVAACFQPTHDRTERKSYGREPVAACFQPTHDRPETKATGVSP